MNISINEFRLKKIKYIILNIKKDDLIISITVIAALTFLDIVNSLKINHSNTIHVLQLSRRNASLCIPTNKDIHNSPLFSHIV